MKYYKRFSNCFLVKGYITYTIYDIFRREVFVINKQTYDLLCNDIIDEKSLHLLPNKKAKELLDAEIIFECNIEDNDLFPEIETNWHSPFNILNCIIDIEENSRFNFKEIFKQLDSLSCKNLQLRFKSDIQGNIIIDILNSLADLNIRNTELIIPFNDLIIKNITCDFENISNIIVYDASRNGIELHNGCQIIFTEEKQWNPKQCGVIDPTYFVCNSDLFIESQSFNTCLNGKISIDYNGNIKNCPSCTHSYGNICNTTLGEALNHPSFKKYWNITKDKIDVCKDCEFRHLCTDCRIFIKDPSNPYSQPAKCTYNPYIAKWQGEEGYVPVEYCGHYSPETGFVPDHNKISSLNIQNKTY
ncbi:MAG TPA: grasp-with-spasm system SPASM domain peptide maturase [Tenuifilaceae bacterium]|nr:grasp-with-spasm system SPASM domain peptide maturase [Tenuifilaceae bacterium]